MPQSREVITKQRFNKWCRWLSFLVCPEKEKLTAVQTEPTMWQKVRPWLYMTAMFIGAALIIRVASSEHTPSVERMAADDTETEMEYINMAVENSMLDDYSLYVYLADSDAE